MPNAIIAKARAIRPVHHREHGHAQRSALFAGKDIQPLRIVLFRDRPTAQRDDVHTRNVLPQREKRRAPARIDETRSSVHWNPKPQQTSNLAEACQGLRILLTVRVAAEVTRLILPS